MTKFVGRHGDHSCQHVAYDTGDLELFHAHMKQTGGMPRRGTLIRNDGSDVAITFAEETGRGFYDQIEDAITEQDEAPFFDFERMPLDWSVPAPIPVNR